MESFPKNSKENKIPFKDELVKSDVSEQHKNIDKLYELQSDSTKVIRILNPNDLKENYGDGIDLIGLAGSGKKLYKELENDYDIPAPVEYVVGKDKHGRAVVYGITDKIMSADLENDDVRLQLIEQIEKLYISLSQYYLDKSNKLPDKEMYLTDIDAMHQYVYGTKPGDKQQRLYLVDTDLYMRNDKVSFYYVVAWLIRHMSSIEKRANKHFDVARENIEKIIKNPQIAGLNESEIENIGKAISEANNFLAGRFSKDSDDLPTGIFPLA